MKALVDAAIERHGKLDVMVNNAGWTHRNRPALEVSEEEFDRCFSVNMKSIYLSTIHAVPAFRANGGGVFINIASTAGAASPTPRPDLGTTGRRARSSPPASRWRPNSARTTSA